MQIYSDIYWSGHTRHFMLSMVVNPWCLKFTKKVSFYNVVSEAIFNHFQIHKINFRLIHNIHFYQIQYFHNSKNSLISPTSPISQNSPNPNFTKFTSFTKFTIFTIFTNSTKINIHQFDKIH